jgi:hypothetical protein
MTRRDALSTFSLLGVSASTPAKLLAQPQEKKQKRQEVKDLTTKEIFVKWSKSVVTIQANWNWLF